MKPSVQKPPGYVKNDTRVLSKTSNEDANACLSAQRYPTSSSPKVGQRSREVPPAVPSPPNHDPRESDHQTLQSSIRSIAMAYNPPDNLSQWLFADHEINNTPSILDGLPPVEERARRAKGVNFIVQAGILLKIPQLTLGTAAVFFHRFYMRYSMVPEKGGLHHYNIAATALFLATKAEENCRKTKEIVIAVAKVAQKNASLIIDEQSKEFWRWKDSILLYEETMLELLTFDVVLESPYNFLMNFLKDLEIEHNKTLRNVAWAFLNDSCMTTLCLRMTPKDIAISSLYFSAKFNDDRIPDAQDGTPWWVRIDGNVDNIVKAIAVMNEFYLENPLKRSDNPYEQSPEGSLEDLESTRQRADSRSPATRQHAEAAEDDSQLDVQVDHNGHINNLRDEDITASSAITGDDDSKLKEIANHPETHEAVNGNGNSDESLPVKRKDTASNEDLDLSGPKAKKSRLDNTLEENEEGEVEE